MGKIKIIGLITLLSVSSFGATSASATITASNTTSSNVKKTPIQYTLKETSEGNATVIKWQETNENGQRKIEQISKEGTETAYGNHNTHRWTYKNNTTGDQLDITIENDTATIQQTKNNTTTKKTTPLNKTPFKFPPSFFMADFIQSKETTQFIWVANKKDTELRQMIFTKLENETVTHNNRTTHCIKLEMKPTGFAGMFWKAYYWFDATSGDFIKYIGKKGPPGTPDFLIEKIN